LVAEQKKRATAERRKSKKPSKLSYKDQRELDQLPAEIQVIEQSIAELQRVVATPDFYTQDNALVQQKLRELDEAESRLEQRVGRWGELETMKESLQSH